MPTFTPVTSMLRPSFPDPIGVDQLKRQNALAERERAADERRNALFAERDAFARQQVEQSNAMAREQAASERQRAAVRELGAIAQFAQRQRDPRAFVASALQNPNYARAFAEAGIDPGQVDVNAPDFEMVLDQFAALGPQVSPDALFNRETAQIGRDEAARIAVESDRRQHGLEIARLREEARLRQVPGPVPGKPLPVGALKLVDDAKQAMAATGESRTLIDRSISKIRRGEVKLGPVRNLIARGRNVAGESSPESRAYADIKQTFEKLRNNYLLLAKGVQTEGDAQRAWNSEIGEDIQNDNELALQQLQKARELIERATQMQNDRVDQVYANYGTEPPRTSGASGSWQVEEVR
jgi:hypothetical protein